jgi:hypothetical protein
MYWLLFLPQYATRGGAPHNYRSVGRASRVSGVRLVASITELSPIVSGPKVFRETFLRFPNGLSLRRAGLGNVFVSGYTANIIRDSNMKSGVS